MKLEDLKDIIIEFSNNASKELESRWSAWHLDLKQRETHEVVGGLLARQVSLATEIIANPGIWNGHVAPVVLRSMIDTHITLAWICGAPQERSRRFIHFGLGQAKLEAEHRKAEWQGKEPDERSKATVEAMEEWVNSQR